MKDFRRSEVEIMAPVGSFDSLAAAIQAGTNSIYFGIGKLNMRSHSSVNFSLEDMQKIVNECNNHNINTYLTVNTVMYEEDLTEIKEVLQHAKNVGITAVIASDMAAILAAREIGIEVHLSTQVNISNSVALKYYSQFSDVVVLARELNMNQVASISEVIQKENITGPSGNPVKLEMFCHGALCMAISGKCYLSLHEHNKSANRGECLQVCRRSYKVQDEETGLELSVTNPYIMSPKDLCTIGFLDRIMESGVRVLKIEGRARPAEYVKIVVETYNEALQSIEEGTYTPEKVDAWKISLSQVFNRGFWNGYYLGQRLGEWNDAHGAKTTRRKAYLGKCTNYFSKLKVGEFLMETGELKVGDEILISGPSTGAKILKVEELRFDLQPVEKVIKGQVFSMFVGDMVRRSDKLYSWEEVLK